MNSDPEKHELSPRVLDSCRAAQRAVLTRSPGKCQVGGRREGLSAVLITSRSGYLLCLFLSTRRALLPPHLPLLEVPNNQELDPPVGFAWPPSTLPPTPRRMGFRGTGQMVWHLAKSEVPDWRGAGFLGSSSASPALCSPCLCHLPSLHTPSKLPSGEATPGMPKSVPSGPSYINPKVN